MLPAALVPTCLRSRRMRPPVPSSPAGSEAGVALALGLGAALGVSAGFSFAGAAEGLAGLSSLAAGAAGSSAGAAAAAGSGQRRQRGCQACIWTSDRFGQAVQSAGRWSSKRPLRAKPHQAPSPPTLTCDGSLLDHAHGSRQLHRGGLGWPNVAFVGTALAASCRSFWSLRCAIATGAAWFGNKFEAARS